MGPVDRWWNEHFPPYSWARLGFGIAAIPFIGLIWYPLNGETFTWGRYIAITLMTQAFLAVIYPFIRARRDEIELDETGKITWKTEDPTLPWQVTRPDEKPGMPEPISDLEREAVTPLLSEKKKPAVSPQTDFIASFVIGWVAFTMTLVLMLEESAGIVGIAMAGVGALLFTIALTFRRSLAVMIVISAILGLPLAYIASGFFYVISFFSDQGPLWIWWLLCSLGVFSFITPAWFAMRHNRTVTDRLRIPNWVTASLVSMFLVVSAAMASWEAQGEIAGAAPPPASDFQPTEGAAPSNFGAGTRDEAMLRIFFAWRNNDRAAAQRVAQAEAVNGLFALPFESSSRFLGCGVDASGVELCVIRRPSNLLAFAVFATGEGRFFIAYFEEKPLDHPIDYSRTATPAPTTTP